MNENPYRAATPSGPADKGSIPSRHTIATASSKEWLRAARWLSVAMAVLLWLFLVCGLPLQTLLESHRLAKDTLIHRLQTDHPPDAFAILDAFDRIGEQTVLWVAWLAFLLGGTTLFVVAHLVSIKRRLDVAERNVEVLSDVVFGIDGVPLR